MKKLTSVLLSLVMLMSVLCLSAQATEQTDCLQVVSSIDETANTVTVTFAAGETTTNGKLTIEFDTDNLSFVSADVTGTLTNTETSNGLITISYATSTANAIQTGETVATLQFSIINTKASAYLYVTVKEFNNQERLNTVLTTITVDALAPIRGDVNLDGVFNTRDIITILQALASKSTSELPVKGVAVADTDNNGKLSTRDAITLLLELAALPPSN